MENFRDFDAGVDPFGHSWHAWMKYLQTGISIRHSDSVDVRYVLDNGDDKIEKTIVLQNEDLRAYSKRTGRTISDAWCSRLAMCKLLYTIETAEDIEKDYLPVTPAEIEAFDKKIVKWEEEWPGSNAA
jgi:hypothetical protein